MLHRYDIGYPGVEQSTFNMQPISPGEENRIVVTPFFLPTKMDVLRIVTFVGNDGAGVIGAAYALYKVENPSASAAGPSKLVPNLLDGLKEPLRYRLVDGFDADKSTAGNSIFYVKDLRTSRALLPGVYALAGQYDSADAVLDGSMPSIYSHAAALLAEHQPVNLGAWPARLTTTKHSGASRQGPFAVLRSREGLRSHPNQVEVTL